MNRRPGFKVSAGRQGLPGHPDVHHLDVSDVRGGRVCQQTDLARDECGGNAGADGDAAG